MAVDVTPPLEAGAKFIDSYGPNRFKITDEVFEGSVIVFPDKVVSWDVTDVAELTVESFQAVFDADPTVELLLLGCGEKMMLIPSSLRQALREKGTPPDFMDTGAACRTYNILLGEGRRVAAALIAMPAE
ncbi:Mth938-like domain-containing protein [Curvivirga sp.]|uniref:Mth938-like domain-containing protein n=1 Tax=Curvivirga sp. TaxID=2856848 RepID=UPI003B58FF42